MTMNTTNKRTTMKTLRHLLNIALFLLPLLLAAQDKLASRNGEITFFSSTPMEDITAVNRKATSVFVPATGDIQFAALIKAFEFEKALMQEHFNENYMESNTFPKAIFKGKVVPAKGDDLSGPGVHMATVDGDLTMHGITQHITVNATLTTAGDGKVKAQCDFEVKPEDYGITVPGVVRAKIAEQVQVKVRLDYTKL